MKQSTVEFYNHLVAMFPDVETSGEVTRKQIVECMEKNNIKAWPTEIMNVRASRGVYSIAQARNKTPMSVSAPVEAVEVAAIHIGVDASTLHTLVPPVDANYVAWGNHRDIDTIVKTKQFYPVYISGPTGNGKSTMVEQVCAKNKRPMIRVNLNMMTDEDQLIGTKTLVDGNVKVIEGPLLIAMRYGLPILLDEIDAGSANTLLCLQPILEGKPYYFKLKNEMIHPAQGFTVFATANTKGKGSEDGRYIGTNILNEAFLERFAITMNQDYPTPITERKIVMNLMHSVNAVDEQFADALVKWADAIRRTFLDGGIDETITTRRLTHIVRTFGIFKDKKKAIELCVNRFDEVTRSSFLDLFDKICEPTPEVVATPEVTPEVIDTPF